MRMVRSAAAVLLSLALAPESPAQALDPAGIKDARLRGLESKYLSELNAAAAGIAAHKYPAKFVLSRDIDLSGKALDAADHHSIEITNFEQQTVLLVMGAYAAVYPPDAPAKDRVSRTYLDVAVPLLRAAAPRVKDAAEIEAVVIELSHHVRTGTIVTIDRFENSAFVVPKAVAARIAGSSGGNEQLAALREMKVFIDGKVVAFGGEVAPPAEISGSRNRPAPAPAASASPASAAPAASSAPAAASISPGPASVAPPARKQDDLSEAALARRQTELQAATDRMQRELASQAHFDPAAQPAVTAFRGASYLRIPLTTALSPADAGSQYRLAALAFDRHVSHLVRLVLPYFKDAAGVDGIAFRTSVSAGSAPETVEFFFALPDLRRFADYDITGQQLIDAGVVLINGERAGLDLQSAESVKP